MYVDSRTIWVFLGVSTKLLLEARSGHFCDTVCTRLCDPKHPQADRVQSGRHGSSICAHDMLGHPTGNFFSSLALAVTYATA